MMELLPLILSAAAVVLAVIILIRVSAFSHSDRDRELLKRVDDKMSRMRAELSNEIHENAVRTDRRLMDGLISIQESTEKRLAENQKLTTQTLTEGIKDLQYTTDRKLAEMQSSMNEKLDRSLNERLDENFRQVGDRLESLYKSLGELKSLENGVISLNRTLSNVKTRGVFGEIQLGNILSSTLDKSMYDTNVSTKPGSRDFVEYAVKIPDKDNSSNFIYLPIDSKFPSDIYNKIADAAEGSDPEALRSARKELKERIRLEALSMRDKYISPPHTTDFAVMFLPTEGLYAEALRIDGLAEDCQQRCKIILSGPMTITALLNSLSVGFRYLTVNKKTEEIMRTLGAFKNQFERFDQIIDQTRRSLLAATKKTEALKDRSRMVKNKLKNIETLETEESDRLIGTAESLDDTDDFSDDYASDE